MDRFIAQDLQADREKRSLLSRISSLDCSDIDRFYTDELTAVASLYMLQTLVIRGLDAGLPDLRVRERSLIGDRELEIVARLTQLTSLTIISAWVASRYLSVK